MKVVVKEPGRKSKEREVENTLEMLHNLVGGYIECVSTISTNIVMIVNEEGKLRDLDNNFEYYNDMIVGTAVFVGVDGEDFRSLTDEEIDEVKYDILLDEWKER